MSFNMSVLTNEALQRSLPFTLRFTLSISAAKTASLVGKNGIPGVTFGFDTAAAVTDALGQTTIDNLLGLTSDVVAATAFGSTAMGTDAVGFVLACSGQVKLVHGMRVTTNTGASGATLTACAGGITTALPNTLPALARCALTAGGNVAGQFVIAGIDSVTSGYVVVEIDVELK